MARDDGKMASIPLACSSSGDLILERAGQLRRLAAQALLDSQRTTTGIRLRFKATHEVESGLREFARWESGCCPFLDFTIRTAPDEDAIVVDVSAPQEASAILDLLVALTDSRRT